MGASKHDDGGGLSLQTLVIASLSSLAAALFVHEFWPGGAILGAAVTPVIVALVSEALRKPAQAITRREPVNPPPVVTQREDRFGIWEDQRPRRRLHVWLAVVTGVAAFALAAVLLTGAELVLGGAGEGDRFRVVPGKQRDRGERDAPARTQPGEIPPAAEEEQAPEEEAPPATTPPTTEPPPPTTPEEAPPDAVPQQPGATAPAP